MRSLGIASVTLAGPARRLAEHLLSHGRAGTIAAAPAARLPALPPVLLIRRWTLEAGEGKGSGQDIPRRCISDYPAGAGRRAV